jgi:N-acetyl-anhydromuramyl-L-alanine amidase AmpD
MRSGTTHAARGILFASLLLSLLLVPRGADSARARKRSPWRYIVIHHSATRKGNAFIMDRYHRNRRHMSNGLAYHFVVNNGSSGTRDGEVEEGKRWARHLPGGHCRQAWINESGIGICLVGNFNRTAPTRKQMESLTALVDRLRKTYNIPVRSIKGHREIRGERTECPGRYFFMNRFRERLQKMDAREKQMKIAERKTGPAARASGNPGSAIPAGSGRAD